MQRSGGVISGVVAGSMLDDAVAAFGSRTAVLSVYLSLECAIENASQHNRASWRARRDDIAAEGAPDPALEAVDRLVPDAHHAGRTLCVVADGGGLLHASAHR